MPEKVSINQTYKKNKRDVIIPGYVWFLISVGSLIAGTLGWSSAYLMIPDSDLMFLLTTLIGFIMGMIPVCLATFLERKHRTSIYWLSFFAIWLPAGIFLWLIATIWAVFDKRA